MAKELDAMVKGYRTMQSKCSRLKSNAEVFKEISELKTEVRELRRNLKR